MRLLLFCGGDDEADDDVVTFFLSRSILTDMGLTRANRKVSNSSLLVLRVSKIEFVVTLLKGRLMRQNFLVQMVRWFACLGDDFVV